MKKVFSTLIVVTTLYSCNVDANLSAENLLLKQRITELESQVQSCLAESNALKLQAKAKPLKKVSKKKTAKVNSLYSGSESSTEHSTKKSYSSQCQAITKKGYQCSRNSRSGGYCWQHGG
jgi:DNA phosphorothioation-dependent restriction protein DptG